MYRERESKGPKIYYDTLATALDAPHRCPVHPHASSVAPSSPNLELRHGPPPRVRLLGALETLPLRVGLRRDGDELRGGGASGQPMARWWQGGGQVVAK